MNKKYIIDSSALLAALYNENSTFNFEEYLPYSIIHVVNLSEVIAVLLRDGMEESIARKVVLNNISDVMNSSVDEAALAANIRVGNKEYGISTGDSFCLAAAKMHKHPVITADRAWSKLDIGLDIIYIR